MSLNFARQQLNTRAQPENFELHLKIVEHVLKYVTHRMLSTVLKYVLRIFELPGPGVTSHLLSSNFIFKALILSMRVHPGYFQSGAIIGSSFYCV